MGWHEHAREIHNMQRTVEDLGKVRETLAWAISLEKNICVPS